MFTSRRIRLLHLHILLSIIGSLLIIGLLFVYSASSVYALATFGNAHYFVKKQLIGIAIGLCTLFFMRFVPLELIKKWCPLFFFTSLALTAATLITNISQTVHGSSRWLTLGGFTFQPSELLKVSLPLYLAYFLEKKMKHHAPIMYMYIPLGLILGLTSIILLKQPDFGLTMTLLITTLALLFVARFNIKHLLYGIGALMVSGILLIAIRPYRMKRLLTFLNPWEDPQGSGFQIIQSLIAIGSGHWAGTGIAHSKQKFFYLPMQHTDFIFSIIAEESGFIGCFFLIMLYILLLYFGIKIAMQLPTFFTQLTVIGYVTLISLQTVINMAVATGLVPTKGIGLPFISYGNTALVCNLLMVAIITNIVYES